MRFQGFSLSLVSFVYHKFRSRRMPSVNRRVYGVVRDVYDESRMVYAEVRSVPHASASRVGGLYLTVTIDPVN
jgi:hypothetical protein